MHEYRYMVTMNGYELDRVNRKIDAIAEAREIWRNKTPVSLYLHGERDENGKEIRREEPLTEVEVLWIGDEDSRAVWFRSLTGDRKVG